MLIWFRFPRRIVNFRFMGHARHTHNDENQFKNRGMKRTLLLKIRGDFIFDSRQPNRKDATIQHLQHPLRIYDVAYAASMQ